MLQSGQNLVRFPSTRLLGPDYGAVLANTSRKLQHLEELLSTGQRDILSCQDLVTPPHLPVARTVDSSLAVLERESVVKNELTRQVSSLQRCIAYQQQRLLESEPVVKTLLAACRSDPAGTAQILWAQGRDRNTILRRRKGRGSLMCANGNDCGKVTLPFSKFCLEHQSCDPNQMLYPSCIGIDSNSLIKCNQTVLDIFSDNLLCPKHSSEALPLTHSTKRKAAAQGQLRPPQKKAKLGVTKVVKEKGNPAQSKVVSQIKLKGAQVDVKAPSLSSWNSDEDTPSNAATSEGSKPAVSSKSLDDLLTLDSSLSARLPKLDLLPLKADIGEIMMAGEDDSGDDLP